MRRCGSNGATFTIRPLGIGHLAYTIRSLRTICGSPTWCANHHLAKSISNAGWAAHRITLAYEAACAGTHVIECRPYVHDAGLFGLWGARTEESEGAHPCVSRLRLHRGPRPLRRALNILWAGQAHRGAGAVVAAVKRAALAPMPQRSVKNTSELPAIASTLVPWGSLQRHLTTTTTIATNFSLLLSSRHLHLVDARDALSGMRHAEIISLRGAFQ
jgi:hypothetical protein